MVKPSNYIYVCLADHVQKKLDDLEEAKKSPVLEKTGLSETRRRVSTWLHLGPHDTKGIDIQLDV